MRLSIKAKKTEVLLDEIQSFLMANSEEWSYSNISEDKINFTPAEKELQGKSSVFFYIKSLGNKKYIRGEFTNDSTDKELNNRVTGKLIELLFNHFSEDIIRLSILKKKKADSPSKISKKLNVS